MRRFFGIYSAFIRQQFQALMEYKADFLMGTLGLLLQQVVVFFVLFAVFTQVKAVGSWGFEEMLLIFGYAQLIRGIDHVYNDNIWFIAWYSIRDGKFYQYLIRPWSPLSLIVMERISIDGLGEVLGAGAIFLYAKAKLGVHFGAEGILALFWFTLCGLGIYFAVKLVFASVAFWTTTSGELMSFAYESNSFSRYPLDIYQNRFVQFFVTFVLPFAVVSFFPMIYFLRTDTELAAYFGMPGFQRWWLLAFTTAVSVAALGIAVFVWRLGIKNYQATGT